MAQLIYAFGCVFLLVSLTIAFKVSRRHNQKKELSRWIQTTKDERTRRRPRNYKNKMAIDELVDQE